MAKYSAMLPHHHIDFLHFKQILKSVTLQGQYELPEDGLNDDRNKLELFKGFNMNILD